MVENEPERPAGVVWRLGIPTLSGAAAGVCFFHPVAMVIEHLAGPHAAMHHAGAQHIEIGDHILMAFSLEHVPMALYYAMLFAVVGGTLGFVAQKIRRKSSRISALERLLPICANCKLIRTEDERWMSVEEYFSRTQGTEFSHGICPSCASELYPKWRPSGSADDPSRR